MISTGSVTTYRAGLSEKKKKICSYYQEKAGSHDNFSNESNECDWKKKWQKKK
jgi:hypothetical protein